MRTLREKYWMILYMIFAKPLPISRHLRIAKLIRVFFARRILHMAGKDINIEKGAMFNGQVSIGDYSGIGVDCELNGPVTIGKYVNMGPEVVIYTQNHAFSKTDITMQEQGYENYKPVKIGDDVWLGRRVIILPGVNIGPGCIIGAGSIVTKSIPPYSVAAGNPARVIRNRKQL